MYKRPTTDIPARKHFARAQARIFTSGDALLHDAHEWSASELDQYYTKVAVAEECLTVFGPLDEFDLVLEPSAGDGAFYSQIKHTNIIGLDIAPRHPAVITADWLEFTIDARYQKIAVVGNPPFGRFNNLSTAFIKHALRFSPVTRIGFILPDVYNKHTRQTILPDHWRIKTIHKLPRDAFLFENETRHIPCSFFVFCQSAGKDLRAPTQLPNIVDFSFSNANDYDVFVFGGAPKKILMRGEVRQNNRGHFLKAHIDIDKLVTKLHSIQWRGNSCASGGVYWLTKNELAVQYHQRYGGNK